MSKCLKIIFFSLFTTVSLVHAKDDNCSRKFNIHKRKAHDKKIRIIKTCISSLNGKDVFETDHFKIVFDTETVPLPIDHDLKDKAATVLYHLERARNYFLETFGNTSLNHLEKMTIRLDISRGFTDVAQFMSESRNPQFNNAVTIPPSGPSRISRYAEWGHEIWFRPAKKVEVKDQFTSMAEMIENGGMQESTAVAIAGFSAMDLIQDMTSGEISNIDPLNHLQTLAISLGLVYILPKIFFVTGKIVKKYAHLETALVPEIIYHEFTHAAFADSLSPRISTPVVEGVANFFATQIAGGHQIAHRTGNRQRGYGARDGKKSAWYQIGYERNALAQSNFVFRLLFATQQSLGTKIGSKVLFDASKSLSAGSDIKYDLINEIFNQVRLQFNEREIPSVYLRLSRTFSEFGL